MTAAPAEKRLSVLLVDDEPALLTTTAALLEDDFDVVVAESGEKAMELLRTRTVDVVCADYKMTGMDGLELLRRVGELPGAIAGVLITGFRDVAGRYAERSQFHLVLKPYEPGQLMDTIRKAANARTLRKTISEIQQGLARGGGRPPPSQGGR